MAEPSWRAGRPGPAAIPKAVGGEPLPAADQAPRISCRATNPLSLDDDLDKVFLDEQQARATTATRLFRNDGLFGAITERVAPEHFRSSRQGRLDMWSTGCSSGEEVYSMAMTALEEFERRKRRPFMAVFGTDINRSRIVEARAGVYTRPAQNSLSQRYWRLLASYCELDAREVRMGELVRSLCKFTLFDMRNRPKNHTFNFIVCNHVMQYYDAPGQRHIICNLKATLKPGGLIYLEGVTEEGLAGSGLKKVAGHPGLYAAGGG